MNGRFKVLLFAVVATALMSASSAFGQRRVYRPSNLIDHVIRNNLGDVIRRYQDDLFPKNSTYIIPHANGRNHGNYYVRNGEYYYIPHTTTGHQTYRPKQVTFGSFSHVDDLASRFETLSNEFCLNLHHNYSHDPGFRETYREAYQMLQIAKYIHAAEHQLDRRAIQKQLRGVDQLFHHIQEDVRGWSRFHRGQIEHKEIVSQMTRIESTLHHLMNDVGVKPTPFRPQEAEVELAPAPRDQAPAPRD